MAMKAFTDDIHPFTQGDFADAGLVQGSRPRIEPSRSRGRIGDRVVKRGHQVRLTQTALSNDHNGAALIGANGLDSLQQIVRGIGNFEEFLSSNLSRARTL